MNKFSEILDKVTVPCKDDGVSFEVSGKIDAIKGLLEGSDYKLQHEGKLSLVYAKHEISENDDIVLVVSHIDSSYDSCSYVETEDMYEGTLNNSVANASVIYNMLHDQFEANVAVAFTGDGLMDCHGCDEAVDYLEQDCGCYIRFGIVADLSSEGWEEECPFIIRNDFHVDMFTAQRVVDTLVQNFDFLFMHIAGHDDAWNLDEMEIPCFTMALPVGGDNIGTGNIQVRKESLSSYCCGLAAAAMLVGGAELDEETYGE